MTQSRGIGRGGPRPGSGRKLGSRNRRTMLVELLPRLAEEDRQLPLYRLLDRIADPNLDPKYRDLLSIATLAYLHPKPRSDLTAKAPFQMTDDELAAVKEAETEHQKQLARGKPALTLVTS